MKKYINVSVKRKSMNETEKRILSSLVLGCKRISEILKIARVSKATFHRLIERMVDSGLVLKDVAVKEGYPPPVYYYISEKGKEELRKELKIDEFLIKFEKEEIELKHVLVLNEMINILIFGEKKDFSVEELEYLTTAILSNWIERKNSKLEITKEGWKNIFKFLPSRELQTIQIIKIGKDKIDWSEIMPYLAMITILLKFIGEIIDEIIPVSKKEEFFTKLKSLNVKISEEIREKIFS